MATHTRSLGLHMAIAATLMLRAFCACAQHDAGQATEHHRHELSVLLAHTHVSQGVDANGDITWLTLPSWGLNYNYWLSPDWAIGLHTDLINEVFKVEENLHGGSEKPVLERTRPVAPALMATYRPGEHWSFILGAGQEFAKEQDLFLLRAGLEYSMHLGGVWETSASLAYDARFDAYDSWMLGIGITRMFGLRQHLH
ncbi:MAG: hypothetical protein JNL52_12165 [Flavobacteriales bacterium]|nr:hypothetical protein [Flavobacteriales bacterium]